jgi:hypothetical protein
VREAGQDWKLVVSPAKQIHNVVVEERLKSTAVPEYQLFDLKSDAGERKNLAEQHPEVVEKLKSRLDRIKSSAKSR